MEPNSLRIMTNYRRARLPLLAWLAAAAVYAQTAQITGRVTDASGAVAPGAAITVRNVGTGIDRRVTTNVDGYYAVPLLSPGQYRDHHGSTGI